jgi:choline dehydrogenase-like flavoprotein
MESACPSFELMSSLTRLSVFRTYVFPYMDRPNLTVLTHALVTKLTLEGKRATGVEIACDGKIQRIAAGFEVVLSLGAMHTPKVLMLSGIGDEAELQRLRIPVVQDLPGVGQNFQDHFAVGCMWEYQEPLAPRNKEGRQRSSGRAVLDLTLRICRPAKSKVRWAAPRQLLNSIHPRLPGRCMEVSYARKAEARFA